MSDMTRGWFTTQQTSCQNLPGWQRILDSDMTTRYVPCFDATAGCQLDWTAISAMGGVIAALLTAGAVAVALIVGVWPILFARKHRARVGRAEARIAAVELSMQALHIGAALKLLEAEICAPHVFKVAADQLSVLNADACVRVIPFLDCLPAKLEPPLALVIANIGTGIRALKQIPSATGHAVATGPTRSLYEDVLASIETARSELAATVGGGFVVEALEPSVTLMAEKLRRQATGVLVAELEGRRTLR